jgi:hypothetical protein
MLDGIQQLKVDGQVTTCLRLHGFREDGGQIITLRYQDQEYMIGRTLLEKFFYFKAFAHFDSVKYDKPSVNSATLIVGPHPPLASHPAGAAGDVGDGERSRATESPYGDVSTLAFDLFLYLLRWYYVHPIDVLPTDAYALGMPVIGADMSPHRDRFPRYPEGIDLYTWLEVYRISSWCGVDSLAEFANTKVCNGILRMRGKPLKNDGSLFALLEALYDTSDPGSASDSESESEPELRPGVDVFAINDPRRPYLRNQIETICMDARLELLQSAEFMRIYYGHPDLQHMLDLHSINRNGGTRFTGERWDPSTRIKRRRTGGTGGTGGPSLRIKRRRIE